MAVTVREYYSKRLKKKTFGYEIDTIIDKTRIREVKRGFSTKTEAREEGRRKELEFKKKSQQGYSLDDIISKDKNKITVKELLELWLSTRKSSIAPKTYSFYDFCNKMIIDDLGTIKARGLKTEKIELAINKRLKDGISSTTAGHYYTVLNIAYNWAITRGYVIKNPCFLIKKPKNSKKEIHVFNYEQLIKLLNAIKNRTIYIPVMLSSTTGIRLGEVCGLRWESVDLDNGFIEVKEQLQKEDGELKLLSLKTAASKRKVLLLDISIEALKELKIEQEKNKAYLGDNYNKFDFVVCQNDGSPYDPAYISRNYRRVVKDYKYKIKQDNEVKKLSLYELLDIPLIRFHDLRHTQATLMLKANIHPKIVADRLGHSNTRLVMDTYSHILPDMQQEAVNTLNDIMKHKK
ncbi:MAG: tyrosine-type recombinase/integrase [Clostridiaceae bacterium]